MTLGEKIKRARLAKNMTQRQVAGERITRNMLSKIENGSATPSLKTLEYISNRMGLPAGYFMEEGLGDGAELRGVGGARECCRRGDFTLALELLEGTEGAEFEKTDEIEAIRALACCGVARTEYRAGELARARAYAREAIKHNEGGTLYHNGDISVECRQIIMLCAVRSKNPYIIEDGREAAAALHHDESRGGLSERTELIERFWLVERTEKLTPPADGEPKDAWARAMRYYLLGREALQKGNADEAHELLLIAQDAANDDGGRLLRDDILAALEQTCRERGDFRAAYEIAAQRLAMQNEY